MHNGMVPRRGAQSPRDGTPKRDGLEDKSGNCHKNLNRDLGLGQRRQRVELGYETSPRMIAYKRRHRTDGCRRMQENSLSHGAGIGRGLASALLNGSLIRSLRISNRFTSGRQIMRKARVWLLGGMLLAVLSGTVLFVGTSPSLAQVGTRDEHRADQSYWRHHDGHWSHWDARDRRWYYTDGTHWYYHDNNRWAPYRFDRAFGREGFVRGPYQVPGEGATVVVPTHQVYVPRVRFARRGAGPVPFLRRVFFAPTATSHPRGGVLWPFLIADDHPAPRSVALCGQFAIAPERGCFGPIGRIPGGNSIGGSI